MKRAFLALAVLAGALVPASTARADVPPWCADPTGRPWCDTSLSPDQRASLLAAQLTNDEKLQLMTGANWTGGVPGNPSPTAHVGVYSTVPRLGLPTIYLTDGPAGVRQGTSTNTALPAPLALAASFDPAQAGGYGAVVADEAKHRGNEVIYGPTVDVTRSYLAGRTWEAFGEDPYLSAKLAVPWIRQAQQQGVIATVKHFPINAQEQNRFSVDAEVSDRVLHELYLPPFDAAVTQGGAGMVMCAYQKINGSKSCQQPAVLQTVLRGQLGFQGTILSDYLAAVDDTGQAANGGLDIELPSGLHYALSVLQFWTATGGISWATIDDHVHHILRTLFAFGVFDRVPYADDADDPGYQATRQAHAQTALNVEKSAITLLKNNGALPLAGGLSKIALIGADAHNFKPAGKGGSGEVTPPPDSVVTPEDGIRQRAGGATTVTYDDGTDQTRAADSARGADVAIVFASDTRAEGADQTCLALTTACGNGDQDGLIRAVAAANPNTIVVLETAGPVLTPWASQVKGIVEAWYPGQQGGAALASVLFGDSDPAGRLPISFPAAESDAPTAGDPDQYPGVDNVEHFTEGLMTGYRHFDAAGLTPAFPFGYGLSYTTFGYSGLTIQGDTVKATVTNTGNRRGTAVPQLYLGSPAPGGTPAKQLKGFTKVTLDPGQSSQVAFPLTTRDFSYWDEASSSWKVATGCHHVMVGASERDIALTGGIAKGGATC